jgi:hypothetical protein
MSVPIAASPGRSGFGPELALAYDSGAGNGPFGFGWNLSLPAISRKTDKGLPQYLDGGKDQPGSDVFILSGAEDLVPVLTQDDEGKRKIRDITSPDGRYRIRRYRPYIEGLFARIERWTQPVNGEVHWRYISKDNTATLYDQTSKPHSADSASPGHIFSWLIYDTSTCTKWGVAPRENVSLVCQRFEVENGVSRIYCFKTTITLPPRRNHSPISPTSNACRGGKWQRKRLASIAGRRPGRRRAWRWADRVLA